MNMRVIHMLKKKQYAVITLIVAILTAILYLGLQSLVIGGWHNMNTWAQVVPWYNVMLTVLFALLFSVLVSLQVHNYRHSVCSMKRSAASGGVGAALAFIVPACPACASLPAFLLPAALATTAVGVLIRFSALLLVLSIALVLFGIYIQKGFEK